MFTGRFREATVGSSLKNYTFEFRPNISLNYNRSSSLDSSATFAGDPRGSEVTPGWS